MWEQIQTTKNSIVLSLNYEDFASIEVEKKVNNKGVWFYEIIFHIEEITDQSVVAYKIEEVSKVLENAKMEIEYLYDEIENMDNKDIYDWLDGFVDIINEF